MLEDRIVPASYTVNTLADVSSVFTNPKTHVTYTSLRAAINLANADEGSSEAISFSVSGTIYLDSSYGALPALSGKTFTIDGTGITIDAGGNSGIFYVNADATAEIDNFTLTNAATTAAVTNEGNLTFNGNTVSNCAAGGEQNDGSETETGSNYSNNTKAADGGAINNTGSDSISGATFYNNQSTGGSGGAIYSSGPELTVDGSTFNGNTAVNGGGICNWAGICTITNTYMYNNTATNVGGAVNCGAGLTTIGSGSEIHDNTAQAGGGFSIWEGATGTVDGGAQIYNNTATIFGGGIDSDGTLTIDDAWIDGNSALNYGGGIYTSGTTTATDAAITSNFTTGDTGQGGGIYVAGGTTTTVSGCTISGNTAEQGNGAYINGGTLTKNVSANSWVDNVAP